MARWLYSLLFYLATPLLLARLRWRAHTQAAYWQHIGERFGFYKERTNGPIIWVHAVSVGETRAAAPLITALQAHWPDHRILLTGMTPTGREAGAEVFGEGVIQVYLPYDQPGAVNRFFRHFSPRFGVLMETEIWPNLLAAAEQHQTPVFLANARLSERSARGYARFSALAVPAFQRLGGVAAQTEADAARLRELGAEPVQVCGNIKFDVTPNETLLALGHRWKEHIGNRPTLLVASTREGEEALILEAWRAAMATDAWSASGVALRPPLLVMVPRHPQRFNEIAQLLDTHGLHWHRRSECSPSLEDQVWLGDSMGEMVAYYAMADVAFIGGSLAPLGGQNLIEAAACGCPVIVGPHTFNFLQATEDAIAVGAALRVGDAHELMQRAKHLLQNENECAAMAAAAGRFAAAHRGATLRTLAFIAQQLDPAEH